jgi:predicted Zn finger-like uncharacterized protein
MDLRCERCRAQYVVSDDRVPENGVTVTCARCGHVFRVRKKALVVTVPIRPGETAGAVPIDALGAAGRSAGTPAPGAWRVRREGTVYPLKELTTLQKWIVERRVGRDDEISANGEQWRRLGAIPELSPFFDVVDAAERAPALEVAGPGATAPSALEAPRIGPGASDAWSGGPEASPPSGRHLDEPAWALGGDEDLPAVDTRERRVKEPRSGGRLLAWLAILLAAAVAGAWAYLNLSDGSGATGTSGAPAGRPAGAAPTAASGEPREAPDAARTGKPPSAGAGPAAAPPAASPPLATAPGVPPSAAGPANPGAPPAASAAVPAAGSAAGSGPAAPSGTDAAPAPAPVPSATAAAAAGTAGGAGEASSAGASAAGPGPSTDSPAVPGSPPGPGAGAPPPADASGSAPPAGAAVEASASPQPVPAAPVPVPATAAAGAAGPAGTPPAPPAAVPVAAPTRKAPAASAPAKPSTVAAARRATPLKPAQAIAQARKLRDRGGYEQALGLYAQVLDAEPRNATALAGRGWCYLELSRYASAEASFRSAIEADPRGADALFGMAETYRYMGKKGEAVAFYERFLSVQAGGDDAVAARNAIRQLKE